MKIPNHAKKVFDGIIYDVYHWEVTGFDGKPMMWEGLKRRPSVQLFVQTPDGKWLLQDEERPTGKKLLLMPGGHIEEGEEPLVAGKRELLEETGMTGEFEFIEKVDISYGRTEWSSYFFLVKNATKIQEPQFDGGEKITPLLLSPEEYIAKIQDKSFLNREAKRHVNLIRKHSIE